MQTVGGIENETFRRSQSFFKVNRTAQVESGTGDQSEMRNERSSQFVSATLNPDINNGFLIRG